MCEATGADVTPPATAIAYDDRQHQQAVELARTAVGGKSRGTGVAVLGAAFRPDGDDMRNSPDLDIANAIAGHGAAVLTTDPAAGPALQRERPDMNVMPDDVT